MKVCFHNRTRARSSGLSGRVSLAFVGLVTATILVTGCSADPVTAEGTWGAAGEGEPQLVLDSDGTLTGTDGCNRLTGTWEQADDTSLTFINVASTMMACEDLDTWLIALDTAVLDGETLTVKNADGAEIGTLPRASGD